MSRSYGFYNECLALYGNAGVWRLCNDVFDLLPIAAVIDEKVFCVHGGISPALPLLEQINAIHRQAEIGETTPQSDLCWSYPGETAVWRKVPHGTGYIFGEAQTMEFVHTNRLEFVARSHQVEQDGHKWEFGGALITIFSSPNYVYRGKNQASVMQYGFDRADPRRMVTFGPSPDRIVPFEEYFQSDELGWY
jgi:diadenosine tetraphosphatase ApaH/serine/threonine PP2A family protein phosphatase